MKVILVLNEKISPTSFKWLINILYLCGAFFTFSPCQFQILVDSGGIQSLLGDGRVGTPPRQQEDMDQLHQLQRQHHTSHGGERDKKKRKISPRPYCLRICSSERKAALILVAGGDVALLPGYDRSRTVPGVFARFIGNILLFQVSAWIFHSHVSVCLPHIELTVDKDEREC